MVIYPASVEVTQARIQLLVDQTAKAPPNTINQDLQAVYDAKAAALEAARAEVQAREPSLLDIKV
jgi:Iap family predicted aminopeptidase